MNKKEHRLASLLFILISSLSIVGLCFHEPWFDEAQAWLIARDASLKDLLFVIPHYEGHPSFWHILLMIPAKLGLPYLFSIRSVQFIFFELSLWLVLFKSPFKSVTKLMCVFGYFFAYQYCVISRPYALMMSLLFLCAIIYPSRKNKPWLYAALLILLCGTHSYGIAFSGGLIVSDLITDAGGIAPTRLFRYYKEHTKVFASHMVLLIAACMLIVQIIPASDAYAMNLNSVNGYVFSFILCWFMIPADCLFMSFAGDYSTIQGQVFPLPVLIACFIISSIIWLFIIICAQKRKMVLSCILPYLFMSMLMAIYIYPHHFGLFFIYLIHILWRMNDKKQITADEVMDCIPIFAKNKAIKKILSVTVIFLYLAINAYFDVFSYAYDINESYNPGIETAEWIRDNHYENCTFLSLWSPGLKSSVDGNVIATNAFFDKNVFDGLDQGKTYMTHRIMNDKDWNEHLNGLCNGCPPDFVIPLDIFKMNQQLKLIGINDEYSIAYSAVGSRIYKTELIPTFLMIYKKTKVNN